MYSDDGEMEESSKSMIMLISPIRMNRLKSVSCLLNGRGHGEKPCDTETGNKMVSGRSRFLLTVCDDTAGRLWGRFKVSSRH